MITLTLRRRGDDTIVTIIQNTWTGTGTISRCLATLEVAVPEEITARSAIVLALVEIIEWLGHEEAARSFQAAAAASPLGS